MASSLSRGSRSGSPSPRRQGGYDDRRQGSAVSSPYRSYSPKSSGYSPQPRSHSPHSPQSGGYSPQPRSYRSPLYGSRSLSPRHIVSRYGSRSPRHPRTSPYAYWRGRTRSPYARRSRSPAYRPGSHSRSPPRSPEAGSLRRSRSPTRQGRSEGRLATVYVANLPTDTDSREVEDFFLAYGHVVSVKLIHSHDSAEFRGFGFVTFDDPADAETAAWECSGRDFRGRRLKCNIAKYNKLSQRGHGGFRALPARRSPHYRRSYSRSPAYPPPRSLSAASPMRDRYDPARSPSPSGSFSPPAKRRRRSVSSDRRRPSASGKSPAPGSAESPSARRTAEHAETVARLEREIAKLREESAQQQQVKEKHESVVEQYKALLDKAAGSVKLQRVKLKTTTARSQKRGVLMVRLSDAAEKVGRWRAALKEAQQQLEEANAELEAVAAQARAYIDTETAEREGENGAKREPAAQCTSREPSAQLDSGPTGRTPSETKATASAGGEPAPSALNLKPFKISLGEDT